MPEQPEAPAGPPSLEPVPSPSPAGVAHPVADGRFHQLDPQWVLVSRIVGAIVFGVLAFVTLIGVVITLFAAPLTPAGKLGLLGTWALVSGSLLGLALYWPGVSYRHAWYRVDEQGLRIRRGVIWRSDISLPRSRVQHTDVSQGPVERSFGLATLIVHTAGTEHASVSLEGLPHRTAYAIRDFLIEGGEGDAV